LAESVVDGRAETHVARLFDDPHGPPRRPVAPHRAAAAIVDNNHFKIVQRLPLQGCNAFLKPGIRGQRRDHHRDQEGGIEPARDFSPAVHAGIPSGSSALPP
jgi:hypothetical protein